MSPQQHVRRYQRSTACFHSSRLGSAQDGPSCSAQLGSNSTGSKVCQQMAQVTYRYTSVCLCLSVCCQHYNSCGPTISERASGGIRGMGLSLLWYVPSKLPGRCIFPHPWATSLSLLGIISLYLSGLDPSRLLGGASRVQILGLPETGRVFLWLSCEGQAPVYFLVLSWFWESTWYGCTLQPVSDTPWDCVCCSSSAGVKM